MQPKIAPEAPRERQTIRVPKSELVSHREWVTEGTGLAAAARVRDADGRIALVENGWSDGWLLPGGTVEPGETPAEAARREVHEETGLNAVIREPLVVFDQTYVSRVDESERLSAAYVVYAASADGEILCVGELGETEDEIEAARWFETLPENLHDGDLLRPYLRSSPDQ